VVDYLTEIPLPGRKLAPPRAGASDRRAQVVSPSFVAGRENRLVATTLTRLLDAAGARSAAPSNGATRFVPTVLALFGSSGIGKTHLAHGLVRSWQQQRGAEAAEYTTATDFRREFHEAIRCDAVVEFRRNFRSRQLLAIDDLHHLPADASLLQELRYTLDDYEDRGATVVVTSNRPASMLAHMSPDLCSRLASGLTVQIAAPGTAARLHVVRQTSAAIGRALSDDAARRLATGVSGTTNDLIGALFKLCLATPNQEASDADRAEQFLTTRRPTLREIIAVVARYTQVSQKQLKSGSRKQSTVFARAVTVYLARELAGASYLEIGRALGGRDHTTIMHSYRKIEHDRLRCPATQETLNELRRILLSR
jgi:chromosomal replication initiator protein